jgi:hypothetical protein
LWVFFCYLGWCTERAKSTKTDLETHLEKHGTYYTAISKIPLTAFEPINCDWIISKIHILIVSVVIEFSFFHAYVKPFIYEYPS